MFEAIRAGGLVQRWIMVVMIVEKSEAWDSAFFL